MPHMDLPALLWRAVKASRAHFSTLPLPVMLLQAWLQPVDELPLQILSSDRTAVMMEAGGQGRTSEGCQEDDGHVSVLL